MSTRNERFGEGRKYPLVTASVVELRPRTVILETAGARRRVLTSTYGTPTGTERSLVLTGAEKTEETKKMVAIKKRSMKW